MGSSDLIHSEKNTAIASVATGVTATATGTKIKREGGAIKFILVRGATTASTVQTITILSATASDATFATATDSSFVIDDADTASGVAAGTAQVGYIGPDPWVTVKHKSSVATGTYNIVAVQNVRKQPFH